MFDKLAIIEPPPRMVVDITNFCMSALVQVVLTRLESYAAISGEEKFPRHKVEFLKQHLLFHRRQNVPSLLPLKVKLSKKVLIDLSGWRSPFLTTPQLEALLDYFNVQHINCEVRINSGGSDAGQWIYASRTVVINIDFSAPETLADFQNFVNSLPSKENFIQTTAAHELIHFVQVLGGLVKVYKGSSGFGGLPPKSVRSKYGPYKSPEEKKLKDLSPETAHSLKDIEFYTNLSDAIDILSKILYILPEHLRWQALYMFVGAQNPDPNLYPPEVRKFIYTYPIFEDFKQYQPNKWKLAVKRLTNYMQNKTNLLPPRV